MDTKSLLIGLISFMAGGLLVSVVATTIEKPDCSEPNDMAALVRMFTT